jgi:menaquinone-dependent protoporphyrinogen IX oxidase
MHCRFDAIIVKQQIDLSKLKNASKSFPQSEQTALTTTAVTACGVRLVYRCYSCCCNMAGGCTALIKRSLVYHASERLFKELQSTEI